MIDIECAGERLRLLPEKAVLWIREKTLILADVHLGKPAAFRQAGVPVPESTTAADLARLRKIINDTGSERVVILGDLFHARAGLQPEMLETVTAWRGQHAELNILLIPGNHDRRSGAPPENWRIEQMDECWNCPPFEFCHEPKEGRKGYLMAGHIHPAISLREKFGSGLRMPCFCFGRTRAVLPAFGSFTGTANIQRQRGERIFAINEMENQILEL